MASAENIATERIIREHVLRPYEREYHSESWRDLPEVPDKAEIMPEENVGRDESDDFFESWDKYQDDPQYNVHLPKNIVKGPWPSKGEYIAAHYRILREDATASLRNSVRSFKNKPEIADDKFTHVYTHVYIKGLTLGTLGAAFRIEFSHERARKQIRWEQSSRLQQGSMVALTPMRDNFRSICKVAIIAARPFDGGLDQNPPQIDIFWGDPNDAAIDPVEPYVMIESRRSYFEASRHMLVALQKLRTEEFRLSKHLVELDSDITAPDWLEEQRFLDLSSLQRQQRPEIDPVTQTTCLFPEEPLDLYNIDVLEGFPHIPTSGMDKSQMAACERMITKKVSIIQGPPGTGKTFTSVSALRVLVGNLGRQSPPVIIAAQTNHALDQLLNHLIAFEPNILRLGGRFDKENVDILARTLYSLRQSTTGMAGRYKGEKVAKAGLTNKVQEIQMTMAPLLTASLLCDETLLREGIITQAQKESLYDDSWADGEESSNPNTQIASPLGHWVGSGNLTELPRSPLVNLGLPLEESDAEFEQLQQVELEGEENAGDKEMEYFHGTKLMYLRKLTGRSHPGVDDRKVKKLLSSNQNLYDIPMGMRGQIYRYWEKRLNKSILAKLKEQLRDYKSLMDEFRAVKWHNNVKLIRHLGIKAIGCTTTGLSKYRGLLAALQPRILLIEEAAETLEGTVMGGMFESLQQLILVGDHQQLQAHANLRALEAAPYHLSISMFERLINNSVGYTMLNEQRRMVPEVRELLCIQPTPFYADLHDHPSVLERKNRPPVPGMGGMDTYFFHHNWPDQKNGDQSRYNIDEAEMIAGFFNHLVMNGTECSKITVLTFYNGQRKTILKEMKRHPSLGDNTYFNVFTVDSYQGEENDVILLSLVRSNDLLSIGFLENKNRLVVALSRARRGLYIFGNATTLMSQETPLEDVHGFVREPMWQSLLCHMRDKGRLDLEGGLPVTCTNHGKTISLYEANEWVGLAGGCDQKCEGVLSCGHPCPHPCHPFHHTQVICGEACERILRCGHGCSGHCGEECHCSAAESALANLGEMNLGEVQSHFDMPVVGEADWQTPTKTSRQARDATSRPGSVTIHANHGDAFASQDIRNSMPRDSFGWHTRRATLSGSNIPKFGVSSGESSRNSSPTKLSPQHRSSIESWRRWNAKESDQTARQARERMLAENDKVDKSTWVFQDTWKATKIENGVRVRDPASSSQTLVPRFEPSPLAPFEINSKRRGSQVLFPSAAKPNLDETPTETDPFSLPTHAPKPTPRGLSMNTLTFPSKPTQTGLPESIPTAPRKANFTSPLSRILGGLLDPALTTKPYSTQPDEQLPYAQPRRAKGHGKTKSASPATPGIENAVPSYAPLPNTGPLGSATVASSAIFPLKPPKVSKATARPNSTALSVPAALNTRGTSTAASESAVHPNHVATGRTNAPVAASTSLLDLDNSTIATEEQNAHFTDLLGLQVGPSAEPFGTPNDLDEFEKRFG